MKFLIKSTNVHNRLRNAAKQFGFEMKNDLVGETERSTPMYSIFDDAAMTVSHYNTVSEEKTASYKFFQVFDASGAYYVVSMIAGILSFDVERVGQTSPAKFTVSSATIGTDLRSSLLSKLTIENGMGRTLLIEKYVPKTWDIKIPPPEPTKTANIMDFAIVLTGGVPRSGIHTHQVITGNTYAINNIREMLGCNVDEFIAGLKDSDAIIPLRNILNGTSSIQDFINNPSVFGFNKAGAIDGVSNGSHMWYVVLKGSKGSFAIKRSTFLSAIDLSEALYVNMQKQMTTGPLSSFRIAYNTPMISFKENPASGNIDIIATNTAGILDLSPHQLYDVRKREYVAKS